MDKWPKHRSGIRPDFLKQPITRAANTKWKALHILVEIQGVKLNDLWRQKRSHKFVSKIDREIKLKTSVLDNPPELFPALKHPAGCSLQYLIMLAESLGGADWYEPYINRYDEADVEPTISEEKLETILGKIANGNNH